VSETGQGARDVYYDEYSSGFQERNNDVRVGGIY